MGIACAFFFCKIESFSFTVIVWDTVRAKDTAGIPTESPQYLNPIPSRNDTFIKMNQRLAVALGQPSKLRRFVCCRSRVAHNYGLSKSYTQTPQCQQSAKARTTSKTTTSTASESLIQAKCNKNSRQLSKPSKRLCHHLLRGLGLGVFFLVFFIIVVVIVGFVAVVVSIVILFQFDW
jgi:hypothetical protein